MLAPSLGVRLEIRHFPASLADFGARPGRVRQPFGKFLAGEAMLRVALPVNVEGELNERTKARLAGAQLIFCSLALSDVTHQA